MLIAPIALSESKLTRQELAEDKKSSIPYETCALGEKALYLGFGIIDDIRYIPIERVDRVYKRLAVSKGYYEGKTFGTLSYLIVLYDNNKQLKVRFSHEEALDKLLSAISRRTDIPVGKV